MIINLKFLICDNLWINKNLWINNSQVHTETGRFGEWGILKSSTFASRNQNSSINPLIFYNYAEISDLQVDAESTHCSFIKFIILNKSNNLAA